uniref:Uncharacterized protein n=1 Tax=Oryza punctata TaxID=4537 RepID=A0A0E0KK50_ORYPU
MEMKEDPQKSPSLMRLSHCESYCGPPLCYIPCLPKSKDAAAGDAAHKSKDATADDVPAAAAAEEKPPPVQKIEEAVAEKDDDDSKEVDGDEEDDDVKTVAPPPAPLKSNLKKADCADSKCAEKGNVKWLDLLGKDLTEVKEFEPSESGDSMDEDDIAECVCAIQ